MTEQASSLKTGIKYKNTPIGKIPVDWEVVKLGTVSNLKNGINFKKEQKGDAGILTVDVLNMYSIDIFVDPTNLYRVNIDLDSKEEYILKRGDILFVRSSLKKEGVGWASLFKPFNEPATFCGFIIRGRLISKKIIPEFLIYFLRSDRVRERLISGAGQVAITNISQETLQNLEIVVPPPPEQKKIAEILTILDEAIEKTAQVIEKTKEVKKGLMQKLLTRGVGHKKFKKTEIGEIPVEWEVIPLNNVLIKTATKDPRSKPNHQFKYVDISGISNEFFKITDYQILDGKDAPSRARKEIKYNDIIYATVRPYLKRIAIVPKELDSEICSTGFCVVRCDEKLSHYKFVFYILHTDWITDRLTDLQRGSNYPAITDKDLYNQFVPLPALAEQKQIAEILSSIVKEIEKESNHKEKLESLKKGLMQVLLTGKVRVSV